MDKKLFETIKRLVGILILSIIMLSFLYIQDTEMIVDTYATETDISNEDESSQDSQENIQEYQVVDLEKDRFLAASSTSKSTQINGLKKEIEKLSSTLDLSSYKIHYSNLSEYFWEAFYETPIAGAAYGYIYAGKCDYSTSTGYVQTLYLTVDYSDSEIGYRYERLLAKTKDIIDGVDSSWSDQEKVLYAHDYLAYSAVYDYENYYNDTIPYTDYTAYGILIGNEGVCQGYAEAFYILMYLMDIDCNVVQSDALNHAWNQVYIGGYWYHLDVTWDDEAVEYTTGSGKTAPSSNDDMLGYCSHKYFLMSDSEFRNNGHSSWNSGYDTCSSTKYSNYVIRKIYSRNYYYNGNWYYLYNSGSESNPNSYLYTGNPLSTSPGIRVDTTSTSYTQNLGYFGNGFYFQNGNTGEINYINLINNTYGNLSNEASITGVVKEMSIDRYGILYYILESSSSVYSYTLSTLTGEVDSPTVLYKSHVQSVGWQNYVIDGATSGTSGQSLRVEAMRIKLALPDDMSGGITYRAFVQKKGWLSYVSNDALAGTSGQSLRMEAIKIYLTGDVANSYDVYYRVHVQNVGWTGWACNGTAAGTSGFSKRIEAIQIKLVSKSQTFSGSTDNAYYNKNEMGTVTYRTYVQKQGWQSYVSNGTTSGTVGKSLRLEAIQIKVNDSFVDGKIYYRTYVQKQGWQSYVSDGATSGSTGKSLRIEAIKIVLKGNLSNVYDIYYRTRVQKIGWTSWVKNNAVSGTTGQSKRVEAIQIKLVYKNTALGLR